MPNYDEELTLRQVAQSGAGHPQPTDVMAEPNFGEFMRQAEGYLPAPPNVLERFSMGLQGQWPQYQERRTAGQQEIALGLMRRQLEQRKAQLEQQKLNTEQWGKLSGDLDWIINNVGPENQVAMFKAYAKGRGMEVDPAVIKFLVDRAAEDPESIQDALTRMSTLPFQAAARSMKTVEGFIGLSKNLQEKQEKEQAAKEKARIAAGIEAAATEAARIPGAGALIAGGIRGGVSPALIEPGIRQFAPQLTPPLTEIGKLQEDRQRAVRQYGQGSPQVKAIDEVITEKTSGGPEKVAKLTEVGGIRKEFTKSSQDFITIRDSYGRVQESAQDPSAAGDLSLIYNYMKMLDPGSVIRESEFAQAAAAGSFGARMQALVQRAISGQRLADEVRKDFVDRAKRLFAKQLGFQKQLENQYRGIARRNKITPEDVLVDFVGEYRQGNGGVGPRSVQTPAGAATVRPK